MVPEGCAEGHVTNLPFRGDAEFYDETRIQSASSFITACMPTRRSSPEASRPRPGCDRVKSPATTARGTLHVACPLFPAQHRYLMRSPPLPHPNAETLPHPHPLLPERVGSAKALDHDGAAIEGSCQPLLVQRVSPTEPLAQSEMLGPPPPHPSRSSPHSWASNRSIGGSAAATCPGPEASSRPTQPTSERRQKTPPPLCPGLVWLSPIKQP